MKNLRVTVSKDYDNRKAVRKVSDKLVIVNTYLPGQRKADGSFGPSASMEIKVTGSTKFTDIDKKDIKPGTRLEVDGFLVSEGYVNKDGKTISYPVCVATEIMPVQTETKPDADAPETSEAEEENPWD